MTEYAVTIDTTKKIDVTSRYHDRLEENNMITPNKLITLLVFIPSIHLI